MLAQACVVLQLYTAIALQCIAGYDSACTIIAQCGYWVNPVPEVHSEVEVGPPPSLGCAFPPSSKCTSGTGSTPYHTEYTAVPEGLQVLLGTGY